MLGEMATHPRIALRWLVAALDHVDRCNRRVVGLLRRSVAGRAAVFLLDEVGPDGEL